MLEFLNNLDTQLFYLINGHHCTVMDWVMWFFSSRWSWLIAIVAAYLAAVTRTFHLSPFTFHLEKRWWLVLAAIGLCFLLADQGSVQLFKNTVCRLRPCHALPNVHMFREGCGGQYGFISSHAANAFAIALFFVLRYWKRGKVLPICILLWALMTSYSRAYLGKHYPGDLICGALFGALMGWIVYEVVRWIDKKFIKTETKR